MRSRRVGGSGVWWWRGGVDEDRYRREGRQRREEGEREEEQDPEKEHASKEGTSIRKRSVRGRREGSVSVVVGDHLGRRRRQEGRGRKGRKAGGGKKGGREAIELGCSFVLFLRPFGPGYKGSEGGCRVGKERGRGGEISLFETRELGRIGKGRAC